VVHSELSAGAPVNSQPRVTAIVLAYGDEPWLHDVVAAILDATGVDLDVIVVDNGSDAVAGLPPGDRIRVLTPGTNRGFTGGCNLAAAAAQGEFLAFINSDAVVEPDALARLVRVAAEPGVGLATGSIRLADTPERINSAGNPVHFSGLSWAGGNGEPASRYAQRRPVAAGSGCGFVIARERWRELGGFADEYFAYCEDTELSLRLWQRGLSVEYVPDAVVHHHYEFSRNPVKYYLAERNRLALLLTAYQARTLWLLAPMLAVTETAMVATAVAGGWLGGKARGWRWLWRHRRWIFARRRQLQRERILPDADLAHLLSARFEPTNVPAPPGLAGYNAFGAAYWRLVRPLLPRTTNRRHPLRRS
jgi:GT2 family glycosyltransferase